VEYGATLGGDKAYGVRRFKAALKGHGIVPHMACWTANIPLARSSSRGKDQPNSKTMAQPRSNPDSATAMKPHERHENGDFFSSVLDMPPSLLSHDESAELPRLLTLMMRIFGCLTMPNQAESPPVKDGNRFRGTDGT